MPRQLFVRDRAVLKEKAIEPPKAFAPPPPAPTVQPRGSRRKETYLGPAVDGYNLIASFRELNFEAYPIEQWPEGCNRMFEFNGRGPGAQSMADIHFGTFIMSYGGGRVLHDFFVYGYFPEGVIRNDWFPSVYGRVPHIQTQATRPLRNCHFPRCNVFTPIWNHLYIGPGYQ